MGVILQKPNPRTPTGCEMASKWVVLRSRLEYRPISAQVMPSDLEIANSAEAIPIEEVAWKLGIGVEELIPTGDGIAKIRWTALESRFKKPQGFMVLITSVHPTPFGEGKTVTTIGLTPGSQPIRAPSCLHYP